MKTGSVAEVRKATGARRPIVVSVPHAGTEIPNELRGAFRDEISSFIDDTDWFVDRLYGFAPELGITLVRARYSRYLIDLNRDPDGAPLYSDGRTITQLVPSITFLGEPIYRAAPPSEAEITRRKELYFRPYYELLAAEIDELQQGFPQVLLWDAHSIRARVTTIRAEPFPQLILGDRDGTTADARLSACARDRLSDRGFSAAYNEPFKGGQITRHFGKPATGVHGLQLEMAKTNYMDDAEREWHPERAAVIQALLAETLSALAATLEQL